MVTTARSRNGSAPDPLALAPIVVDRQAYYRAYQPPQPPPEAEATTRAPAPLPAPTAGLKPGRQTGAAWGGILSSVGWKTLPRRGYGRVDITTLDIARLAPHQLMETIAEVSPEVSQALWNNLLLTNSDYELTVVDAAGEPDEDGQRVLDEQILPRINRRGGGLDGLIDQWHYTAYLQGALAGELVLAPGLRAIEDIVAVSPWTIEFVREDDGTIRPVQRLPWEQRPRELNETTFLYQPILPAVDDPYGRMPFASVVGVLHFYLQLLRDLQVAVHANAWDKLDITVIESAVVTAMPDELRADPVRRADWLAMVMGQVQQAFTDGRPDDHFIHTDATTIKPVASGSRSVGVVPIFRLLERSIFRALKQLPIMMGSNEGTTETHGTIQFEVFVDAIRMVQARTRHMLETFLTLALAVHGRQGTVVMEWHEIRTRDRQQEANAEATEIANAVAKRDQGWIDQDSASIEVTGTPAVAPAPRAASTASTASASEPEPAADDGVVDDADADDADAGRGVWPAGLGGVRATDLTATPAFARTRADLEAVLARYFRELADGYPAAAVAAELAGLGDDADDDTVAAIVTAWFGSVGARALADGLTDDLVAVLTRGYERAGSATLAALGIAGTFALTSAAELDALDRHVGMRVAEYERVTAERLARLAARRVGGGAGAEELAAALGEGLRGMQDARTTTIAVSEAVEIVNRATATTASRNGVERHRWETAGDDRVDPPCPANDGVEVPIGSRFPSGDTAPPAHPNCRCRIVPVVASDWEPPTNPWRGE